MRRLGLGLMCCVLMSGAAQAQKLELIRNLASAQPTYSTSVARDPVLNLKTNETLLIMDGSSTFEVKGPYSGKLSRARAQAQEKGSFLGRVATLVGKLRYESTVGALRGDDGVPEADLPRLVKTTDNLPPLNIGVRPAMSAQCYASERRIQLWRPSVAAQERYVLAAIGAGSADIVFPVGQALEDWPSTLQPSTKRIYILAGAGYATKQFSLVDIGPNAEGSLLKPLLEAGCEDQARAILRSMMDPVSP